MDITNKAKEIIKETESKEKSFRDIGEFYKKYFDSLIEAGFNENQALIMTSELAKSHISNR